MAGGAPSFGTLLRLHRRRLGLTQEALAEQAGFSAEYIGKIEAGSRRPSAASAEVLAHALSLHGEEAQGLTAARVSAVAVAVEEAEANAPSSSMPMVIRFSAGDSMSC